MIQHTQDDRVRAYDKRDPNKTIFRWPKHLVEMSKHLEFAPSVRNKLASSDRVTEPDTPTNTQVTEPETPTSTRRKAKEAQK